MTHFLRRNGKTIIDVDAYPYDLTSVVCILEYSRFLLDEDNRRQEIMNDFDLLQELRGEYHETPRQNETPDELVGRRLCEIGKKYDLEYVTD